MYRSEKYLFLKFSKYFRRTVLHPDRAVELKMFISDANLSGR